MVSRMNCRGTFPSTLDVRRTSVGRPCTVRRTSVRTSNGRPYRRPSDVPIILRTMDVRQTSVQTSVGRPYERPTDVHTESTDVRRTSARTSVGRLDGRPPDVRMEVRRTSIRTSVRTSHGRPTELIPDGIPSDDHTAYGRPWDVQKGRDTKQNYQN